jgi:hypothetical protein
MKPILRMQILEVNQLTFATACQQKPILLPFSKKHSLQVLHIRQSGSDLEHFASWGIRRGCDPSDSGSDDDSFEIDMPGDSQSSQNKSNDGSLFEDDEFPEIRKTLQDFAEWAFGPKGIPSLRVIAYGDFSYEGRFSLNNVLLCKAASSTKMRRQDVACPNFRRIADNDRPLWALVHKYSNVLEACPNDPLLED